MDLTLACAGSVFMIVVVVLVAALTWEPAPRPPKSRLQQFSEQAQAGERIKHEREGVVYLDSARVSKELRDALRRRGGSSSG